MSRDRFHGSSSSRSRSYTRSKSRNRNHDRNARKENTTIWVGGLGTGGEEDVNRTENALRDTFSDFGKVVDVKMRSTAHDLFAFVQFDSHSAAVDAIQSMDQKTIKDRRVKVSWAQFKGNGQKSKAENYRIWVGRIGSSANEDHLRGEFNEFGHITDVKIRSNDKDTFAFIQFTSQRAASRAISTMNNARFRGNTIKCDWAQYKNRQNNNRQNRQQSPQYNRSRNNNKFKVDSRSVSRDRARKSRSYSNDRSRHGRFQVTTGDSPVSKKELIGSPRKSNSLPKYYSQSRSKSVSGTPPRVSKRAESPAKEPIISTPAAPPAKKARSKSASPPADPPARPHILELENLPPEVSESDLADVGKRYGGEKSVKSTKVWDASKIHNGMIEFTDRMSLQDCFLCLHKRRVNGYRLKVFLR